MGWCQVSPSCFKSLFSTSSSPWFRDCTLIYLLAFVLKLQSCIIMIDTFSFVAPPNGKKYKITKTKIQITKPKPMLTTLGKDLFLRWERSSVTKYLDILHVTSHIICYSLSGLKTCIFWQHEGIFNLHTKIENPFILIVYWCGQEMPSTAKPADILNLKTDILDLTDLGKSWLKSS